MHIPRVDNFEASVPVLPRNLKSGDQIATGWITHDTVMRVEPSRNGAHLTLRPQSGEDYQVHRVSAVPVIKD